MDSSTATSVTIILPVFNAEEGLLDALSRIARTCPADGEVLVVDDGSVDASPQIATEFAATDSRFRVIAIAQNAGVANARNVALGQSHGEYVWFVDWDDAWADDIVQRMLAVAVESDADVVVVGARWRDADGGERPRVESLPAARELSGRAALAAITTGELKGYLWSKLIRRRIMTLPMFPPMRSQSDFCGLVPVLASASKVVVDPEVRYWHIIREGSITNTREPRLENLDLCRDVVHRELDAYSYPSRELGVVYDYAFYHLSRINTAARLSSPERARSELARAVDVMRWRDLPVVFRHVPAAGVKSALVLSTRSNYFHVRSAALGLRGRLRRLRSGRI